MATLILDKSKWRCGGDTAREDCKLGEGPTFLVNDEGFMCCLGQFSLQINRNLRETDMLGIAEPDGVHEPIENLNDDGFNSSLACDAIEINDDGDTTIDEKIVALRELFSTHNYEIEVI